MFKLCLYYGVGGVVSCLLATLTLTLVARMLSAMRKMPSTVFLLAGIFTLVPGSGVYYTAYYLIMNELSRCTAKGIETFKIAGGIIFGLALPQSWFNRLGRLTDRKKPSAKKPCGKD